MVQKIALLVHLSCPPFSAVVGSASASPAAANVPPLQELCASFQEKGKPPTHKERDKGYEEAWKTAVAAAGEFESKYPVSLTF